MVRDTELYKQIRSALNTLRYVCSCGDVEAAAIGFKGLIGLCFKPSEPSMLVLILNKTNQLEVISQIVCIIQPI